jgi:hypothetical protein
VLAARAVLDSLRTPSSSIPIVQNSRESNCDLFDSHLDRAIFHQNPAEDLQYGCHGFAQQLFGDYWAAANETSDSEVYLGQLRILIFVASGSRQPLHKALASFGPMGSALGMPLAGLQAKGHLQNP